MIKSLGHKAEASGLEPLVIKTCSPFENLEEEEEEEEEEEQRRRRRRRRRSNPELYFLDQSICWADVFSSFVV